MEIHCSACGETIKVPQKQPFHAGFSSRGFLYCDETAAILEFSPYNPNYVAVVGDKHPWALSEVEQRRVEDALKRCPTGGRFRFGAIPRCPKCQSPLVGLLRDDIHFIEIGTVVDGDSEDVWQ